MSLPLLRDVEKPIIIICRRKNINEDFTSYPSIKDNFQTFVCAPREKEEFSSREQIDENKN